MLDMSAKNIYLNVTEYTQFEAAITKIDKIQVEMDLNTRPFIFSNEKSCDELAIEM